MIICQTYGFLEPYIHAFLFSCTYNNLTQVFLIGGWVSTMWWFRGHSPLVLWLRYFLKHQSSSFNGQMGRMRIEIVSVIWKQHTPFLPLHCQEWVIRFLYIQRNWEVIPSVWASESPGNSTLLKVKVKVAQSCPTLCDPMGYTVHGIFQARILEWITFPFFRRSSQPRESNPGLPHSRWILYQLSHKESLCTLVRYHQFTMINKSYPWMYLTFNIQVWQKQESNEDEKKIFPFSFLVINQSNYIWDAHLGKE